MMCTEYLFWIHSAVNWHAGAPGATRQSCLAQEDDISILNATCKALIDSGFVVLGSCFTHL